MRTAQEVYETYRIMPSLQLHQLRVAAVGKLVSEHFSGPLDARSVILACLFHDMGNIIKFNPQFMPALYEPEGVDYWMKVKDEYVKKYGPDEHTATSAIIREVALPAVAISLIEGIGFSKMLKTWHSNSTELKIVEYSDCRVAPYGITSVSERFKDGAKRYAHRHSSSADAEAHYLSLTNAAYEIEKQVFARCSIKPEDINDEAAAPLIEELRKFPIG